MIKQDRVEYNGLIDMINDYHDMEWNGSETFDWSNYPSVQEVLENIEKYSAFKYKDSLETLTPELAEKCANDPDEEDSVEKIKMDFENDIERDRQNSTLLEKICKSEAIKNLKWYRQFNPRAMVIYLIDWSDGTVEGFIHKLVGQYEQWKKIGAYSDEEIKQYDLIYGTFIRELQS